MGDRTPDVNSFGKLTSKYLTPCRTFGLKRRNTPKSDILKKLRSENNSSLVNKKSADENSISLNSASSKTCLSPNVIRKNDLENNFTPIKSIEAVSSLAEYKELNGTPCISQKKLSLKTKKHSVIDSKITSVKPKNSQLLNGDHCKTTKLLNVKLENDQASNSFITPVKFQHSLDGTDTISESQILEQIKRINNKYSRLEKLKQDQIYSRKHNLIELKKSTDKWLAALKEISLTLHSELQERGRSCTILDVLVDHNISPERVGFNVESLEFDN